MMPNRISKSRIPASMLLVLLFLCACSISPIGKPPQIPPTPAAFQAVVLPTSLPEPTQPVPTARTAAPILIISPAPTREQVDIPTTGGAQWSTIHDQINTTTAAEKRAYAGDSFFTNRFERPFDRDMNYLPYLDIARAELNRQKYSLWYYFKITLVKDTGAVPHPGPVYGLEIDVNLDGRGDFLAMAETPKTTSWSVDGVKIFEDQDKDVGGKNPVLADKQVWTGSGYEMLLFDAGQGKDPDLAWSRIDSDDPNAVDIAIKVYLLGDVHQAFLWNAYADGSLRNPGFYDLNDHFTVDQAGSPLKGELYYPIKDLFAYDNTCRTASGFIPTGNEPGICPAVVLEKDAPEPIKQ
jgi:hypothetical protein